MSIKTYRRYASQRIGLCRKVFLTNLARESESKTIAAYFRKYGSVVDVKIFRFPSGESRGFGSVEFIDIASADRAIRAGKHVIDHREVEAKLFVVSTSTESSPFSV